MSACSRQDNHANHANLTLYWNSRGSTLRGMSPSRWLSTSSCREEEMPRSMHRLSIHVQLSKHGLLAVACNAPRHLLQAVPATAGVSNGGARRCPPTHLDDRRVVHNEHVLDGHGGCLTNHDAPQGVGHLQASKSLQYAGHAPRSSSHLQVMPQQAPVQKYPRPAGKARCVQPATKPQHAQHCTHCKRLPLQGFIAPDAPAHPRLHGILRTAQLTPFISNSMSSPS